MLNILWNWTFLSSFFLLFSMHDPFGLESSGNFDFFWILSLVSLLGGFSGICWQWTCALLTHACLLSWFVLLFNYCCTLHLAHLAARHIEVQLESGVMCVCLCVFVFNQMLAVSARQALWLLFVFELAAIYSSAFLTNYLTLLREVKFQEYFDPFNGLVYLAHFANLGITLYLLAVVYSNEIPGQGSDLGWISYIGVIGRFLKAVVLLSKKPKRLLQQKTNVDAWKKERKKGRRWRTWNSGGDVDGIRLITLVSNNQDQRELRVKRRGSFFLFLFFFFSSSFHNIMINTISDVISRCLSVCLFGHEEQLRT